jgi:spermidine synthase
VRLRSSGSPSFISPTTETVTPSNLEILAYEDTPLGPLCLRRRELLSSPGTVVTEVTLDHAFLMSSLNTASERALAARAIEMHPGDRLRVLVGGLGLGYTAAAALESPRVNRVVVVEFLPEVITWLERDLFPLSGTLKEDGRFSVAEGDVFVRLAARPEEVFDVILIDVDHAPDDPLSVENAPFYTEPGLAKAQEHLAPGGVLAVWSSAENDTFSRTLERVFGNVEVETVTYFNTMVEESCTDWLFMARKPGT